MHKGERGEIGEAKLENGHQRERERGRGNGSDCETMLEINFIIKKRKETHLIKQFPFCLPTVMFC